MFKFKRLNRVRSADIKDFAAVIKLCLKHKHQLFDDFSVSDVPMRAAKLVQECGDYFWVIKRKRDEAFVGFVFLYDLIGGENAGPPHCATVGTCIKREFWGDDVFKIGCKFLRYASSRLRFKKIKCEVYASNPYITGLLKKLGFVLEGRLKHETLVRGQYEDILIWSCFLDALGAFSSPAPILAQKKGGSPPPDYTSRSINNRKIIPIFGEKRKD